jgi:hypothetical protein
MPRTARVVVPEVSLHVVQRGHDRRDCFFEEGDHVAYLGYLREFALRFGCSIHAYCLMTNHVHLFLTPSSYAINVGAAGATFLRPHPAYEALGDNAAQRASAYVGLFDMPVERTMIDEIRKATRGGYPLGVQRKSRGRPPSERKIGTVPI